MARKRMPKQLGSIGGLGGVRAQAKIEGFDELITNVRRMSDQARVKILKDAVDQGSREARDMMEALAPTNALGPTRARFGHGRDNITIASPRRRPPKDARARIVGPSWRTGRHMIFAEFGTVNHPDQQFVRPTIKNMRARMLQIIKLNYDRAQRSIRTRF